MASRENRVRPPLGTLVGELSAESIMVRQRPAVRFMQARFALLPAHDAASVTYETVAAGPRIWDSERVDDAARLWVVTIRA
jgi:hypothetical protein